MPLRTLAGSFHPCVPRGEPCLAWIPLPAGVEGAQTGRLGGGASRSSRSRCHREGSSLQLPERPFSV